MLVLLAGAVEVKRTDGHTERADTGDVVGLIETLGGIPIDGVVAAASDGSALRFNRSDLFDLLADDTALFQGIASGLLAATDEGRSRKGVPAAAALG
jgi:hypothetical protein